MPFGAITQPAAAGPIVKTGIDACLAAARLTASAGDVYQDDTSKACFVYNDSGSGILVPAEWAGNTLTLMSNGSGSAYVTLADVEDADSEPINTNDLLARGWAKTAAGAGGTASVSKTASNPLILTCTSSGDNTSLTFTPTSAATSSKAYLLVGKIEITAAQTQIFLEFKIPDGTKNRELAPDVLGTAGTYSWSNSSTSIGAQNMVLGTSEKWISAYYCPTGEASIASVMDDSVKGAQALYSGFRSGSAGPFSVLTWSGGSANTIKIYELFFFEVT